MGVVLEPRYFGAPSRRMFGVLHPATGRARAALLLCPPLLHEHVRSYRFFSLLAGELAGAGVACLRFDYYGTGDSEGKDAEFSPADTAMDIASAAAELRQATPGSPLLVMGVRGSALFACRDAKAIAARGVWLWQPVLDGTDYLRALKERDVAERASRYRYPLSAGSAPAGPHDLMGFGLAENFASELAACRITLPVPDVPIGVLDTLGAPSLSLPVQACHTLPDSVTAWVDEVDLSGLVPMRDVRRTLEEMLGDVGEWTGHG